MRKIILLLVMLIEVFLLTSCFEGRKNKNLESGELKPVFLDSIGVLRKYPADELILRNGLPESDTVFSVKDADCHSSFLQNMFPENPNKRIREQIWILDSVHQVAIWYVQEKEVWNQIFYGYFYRVWDIEKDVIEDYSY